MIRGKIVATLGRSVGTQDHGKRPIGNLLNFGNCWLFAQLRRHRKGGRVYAVGSLYGWWRHTYWISPAGHFWEFVPERSHDAVLQTWSPLPPLIFRGRPKLIRRKSTAGTA